jgi:hypothetical protein
MQKLDNFVEMQNENFTAVFVNEENALPKTITPLGIYKIDNGLAELCQYDYLFENIVTYSILQWESREAKDITCYNLMANAIGQQKAFKNLIKD